MPGQVHTTDQARHPPGGGQRFTGIQEPVEVLSGSGSRSHRADLDEAHITAGLGAWPGVADRQPHQPGVVRQQHGIAKALRLGRPDLPLDVQPLVDGPGQFATCAQRLVALSLGHVGIRRPRRDSCGLPDRDGHDAGQEPRPEAELLVEMDVFRAVGEREEAGVPGPQVANNSIVGSSKRVAMPRSQ